MAYANNAYLDAYGSPLQVIDHAVAWLTCRHDYGYGACRACMDAGGIAENS